MPPRSLLPTLQPVASPDGLPPLADDALRGAEEIMAHLKLKTKKQVYKLVEANKARPGSAPPIIHDGTGLFARRSSIDAWYRRRESATQKGRD